MLISHEVRTEGLNAWELVEALQLQWPPCGRGGTDCDAVEEPRAFGRAGDGGGAVLPSGTPAGAAMSLSLSLLEDGAAPVAPVLGWALYGGEAAQCAGPLVATSDLPVECPGSSCAELESEREGGAGGGFASANSTWSFMGAPASGGTPLML